jgi:hypothetical protein
MAHKALFPQQQFCAGAAMAIFSVPDSLGALAELGIPLRVACRNCGHVEDWAPAPLLRRHGRSKRWWEAKLRCNCCDSHGADVQVTPLMQRLRIAA